MRKMEKLNIQTFMLVLFVTSTLICFSRPSVHASDRIGACNSCHEVELEEIGSGFHMNSLLEAGQLYSKCDSCHTVHPEIDGPLVSVHDYSRFREKDLCITCHFSGNKAGASSTALPYKSIICMTCHVSKLTLNDSVSKMSLAAFLLAMFGMFTIWLSGTVKGSSSDIALLKLYELGKAAIKVIFSTRAFCLIKALFMDGLLQRRLFRQSRMRWAIHGLIFFPMLLRFCWALAAVASTRLALCSNISLFLSDKNNTLFRILFFEITGLLTISGIILMALRKVFGKPEKLSGLPKQSKLIYSLFGTILVVGFFLRGMQIAVTGFPDGSEAAFLSFIIAAIMREADSISFSEIYGYAWYLHAVLFGLFIAALPFSRMFHIIIAPFAVTIGEMRNGKY